MNSFSYQYNGRKRWYNWFAEQYPLWYVQRLGNQFQGNSIVIPTIPLRWLLDNADPEVILQAQQSCIDDTVTEVEVPVDTQNLERYVESTQRLLKEKQNSETHSKAWRDKLQRNCDDARCILLLAEAYAKPQTDKLTGYTTHFIPQYFKRHEWGRLYGAGPFSLQYMGSQVRDAAMGSGYNIDLSSSVYMFYKMLAKQAGIPSAILTELKTNKHSFRAELAECLTDTRASEEFKLTLIKKAITAKGFGAKEDDFGSLRDIIRNKADRDRLRNHPKWRELTQLVAGVTQFVKREYGVEDYKTDPSCCTEKGVFRMEKFMAMFYQRYESAVLEAVYEFLTEQGTHAWLLLHDGIMCKRKPDAAAILYVVQQHNPDATVDVIPVERYRNVDKQSVLHNEQQHKQFMEQEEQRAKQWADNQGLSFPTPLERLSKVNPERAMKIMLEENELFNTGTQDDDHHSGPNTW